MSSAAVLFSRRSGGYRAAASLVSASPSTAPLQFRINTGTENYTHSVQQIRQKGITIPSMKKTEKDENLFLGSCPASRGVQYPAVVTVLLPNDFKLAKISIYAHPHGTRELCWFLFLLSVCLKCSGDLQLRVRFPNVTTATEQRLADLSRLTVPCQEMTQPHAAN